MSRPRVCSGQAGVTTIAVASRRRAGGGSGRWQAGRAVAVAWHISRGVEGGRGASQTEGAPAHAARAHQDSADPPPGRSRAVLWLESEYAVARALGVAARGRRGRRARAGTVAPSPLEIVRRAPVFAPIRALPVAHRQVHHRHGRPAGIGGEWAMVSSSDRHAQHQEPDAPLLDVLAARAATQAVVLPNTAIALVLRVFIATITSPSPGSALSAVAHCRIGHGGPERLARLATYPTVCSQRAGRAVRQCSLTIGSGLQQSATVSATCHCSHVTAHMSLLSSWTTALRHHHHHHHSLAALWL